MMRKISKSVDDWLSRVVDGKLFDVDINVSPMNCDVSKVDSVPLLGYKQTLCVDYGSVPVFESYADLRDAMISPANKVFYDKRFQEIKKELVLNFTDFDSVIPLALRNTSYYLLSVDMQGWIADDILQISLWLLAFEERAGFFQLFKQAYHLGCMPVGWRGNFPDGSLLIVEPSVLADIILAN